MAPPRRGPGPPVAINGFRGWTILDASCAQPEDPDVLNSLIYAKHPHCSRGGPAASRWTASRCAGCRGGTVTAPRKRRDPSAAPSGAQAQAPGEVGSRGVADRSQGGRRTRRSTSVAGGGCLEEGVHGGQGLAPGRPQEEGAGQG